MSAFEHQRDPAAGTARVLLVLYSLGAAFRGLLFYNRELREGGTQWLAMLQGAAGAPEQYRIGIVFAASLLGRVHPPGHAGPRLSVGFALFDLVGLLGGSLLLLRLLERARGYREASAIARWFAVAAFLALAFYALDWTAWYVRPGTLPVAGLTALWLWLWTPARYPTTTLRLIGAGLALVILTAAMSLQRADLALFLAAGLWVAVRLGWTGALSLQRSAALGVTALAAGLAAAIQLALMRVVYPHATYGITPVFMLRHDFYRLPKWGALLIFTAPALWTMTALLRDADLRRRVVTGPAAGLLLTAPAYLLLWITFGRLDEVRIFLPVALALLPTTVLLALQRIKEPPLEGAASGQP